MREKERGLQETLGDQIKVVGKCGQKLEDILTTSDPWSDEGCHKKDCIVCSQGEKGQKCSKRSLTYLNTCELCKEKGKESICDTALSLSENGQTLEVAKHDVSVSSEDRA